MIPLGLCRKLYGADIGPCPLLGHGDGSKFSLSQCGKELGLLPLIISGKDEIYRTAMGHKDDPQAGACVSEKLHDEIDILLGCPASPIFNRHENAKEPNLLQTLIDGLPGRGKDNLIILEFESDCVHRYEPGHHPFPEKVNEILGKDLILSPLVEGTENFNEIIQGSLTSPTISRHFKSCIIPKSRIIYREFPEFFRGFRCF